jgi:hypothetical protein
MHRPVGQAIHDHRELPGRARGRDAAIRRVLRQMKALGAIREERRETLTEVQLACIELGNRGNQLHRGVALATGKRLHFQEQLFIR